MVEIDFKQRLKMARSIKQLKQQDLADVLGLSRTTLQAYESGRIVPKGHKISILASALGVSKNWLLYGEGDANNISNSAPEQAQLSNDNATSYKLKIVDLDSLEAIIEHDISLSDQQINSLTAATNLIAVQITDNDNIVTTNKICKVIN